MSKDMDTTRLSKVTLDASTSLLNATLLLNSAEKSVQAMVTELNALHSALDKILDKYDQYATQDPEHPFYAEDIAAELHKILETKEN